MQSSKEQHRDYKHRDYKHKTSSVINAKKQRKTIEWKRLEISSRKLGDTKGIFHVKMSTIKDRNGMDLTEADDIEKQQEYTEELYKKDLNDLDNNDGVITHLEPDRHPGVQSGLLEASL